MGAVQESTTADNKKDANPDEMHKNLEDCRSNTI